MKKNNKGFMLIEAIITSVVIATALIGLYSVFNKLYTSYSKNSKYYSIDGIYAAKVTFNYLFNDGNFNLFINNTIGEEGYKVIMDDNNCYYDNNVYNSSDSKYTQTKICQSIKGTYNVNKMIIVEYDKTVLEENIMTLDINQTFKEYIEFVNGYYDVSDGNTKYSYLILTEINDGEDNYVYANLGVE